MDGSSGYLSHSLMPLYFGLGPAASVDRIEVVWPSGKRQTVAAPIQINSRIEVREP
jgi:ASPIC and UnbV